MSAACFYSQPFYQCGDGSVSGRLWQFVVFVVPYKLNVAVYLCEVVVCRRWSEGDNGNGGPLAYWRSKVYP